MKIKAILGVLGLLAGSLPGCVGGDDGTGSNTNWMIACDSDDECGTLSCACGRCTLPCGTACSEELGGVCVKADSGAHAELCGSDLLASKPETQTLCLPACAAADDCSAKEACLDGACVPLVGEPCPVGAVLSLDAGAPELWARQGMVFGDTLYLPVSYSDEPDGWQEPFRQQRPLATLTDGQGAALGGCTLHWLTARGSGRAYPEREQLDASGQSSVSWVAGSADDETLQAAVVLTSGKVLTQALSGKARRHDAEPQSDAPEAAPLVRPSSLSLIFELARDPKSLEVELRADTLPHHSLYAAFSVAQLLVGLANQGDEDAYAGAVPSDERVLLMSAWNLTEGDTTVLWQSPQVTCGTHTDGLGGPQCNLQGAWSDDDARPVVQRLRVDILRLDSGQSGPGPTAPDDASSAFDEPACESASGCSDLAIYRNDQLLVVFRTATRDAWSSFSTFVEPYAVTPDQNSCLATPRYQATFRPQLDGAPLTTASASVPFLTWHDEVCSNYAVEGADGAFTAATGGPQPLGPPSTAAWSVTAD